MAMRSSKQVLSAVRTGESDNMMKAGVSSSPEGLAPTK